MKSIVIATTLLLVAASRADEPAFRIAVEKIFQGTDEYYFTQARGTLVPGSPGRILVTAQETERFGTHGYRDLFQVESVDGGRTWSKPARIENLRRLPDAAGDETCIGDVTPQWHAQTGVVLATGKTFTFRGGKQEERLAEQVSYSVYDPATGKWSGLQILQMPKTDRSGATIHAPNTGCCQRHDLPDGDILLPIRYRRDPKTLNYVTIVARCRFDGRTLTYVEHGSELSRAEHRGFYEPSLVKFQGRYHLTLRTDDSAFTAVSDDGLNYESPVEWKYDDGQVLGNYNTQQHWAAHDDQLYLIYTRRGANNDHVFRHRAPLFIARVDPARQCVLRATEQILVPEHDADLGNFGVCEVAPNETWVVVAEFPIMGKRKDERNQVFAARLKWSIRAVTPPTEAHLRFAPDSPDAAAVIQIARMLEKPATSAIVGSEPRFAEWLDSPLSDATTIAPRDIERVFIAVNFSKQEFVVVCTFDHDLKPEDVARDVNHPVETIRGLSLHVPQEAKAFCLVDARTLVLGPGKTLRAVLNRNGAAKVSSELAEAWSRTHVGKDFYAIGKLEALMKEAATFWEFENPLPKASLAKIKTASLAADIDVRLATELKVTCDDETTAAQVKTLVEVVVGLLRDDTDFPDEVRDSARSVRTTLDGRSLEATGEIHIVVAATFLNMYAGEPSRSEAALPAAPAAPAPAPAR